MYRYRRPRSVTRTDLLVDVIRAVAAVDGDELDEVDSLHDYIDPEILDRLDDMESEADWRFTFEFGDHQVTVTHDSQVYIEGELYRSKQRARHG